MKNRLIVLVLLLLLFALMLSSCNIPTQDDSSDNDEENEVPPLAALELGSLTLPIGSVIPLPMAVTVNGKKTELEYGANDECIKISGGTLFAEALCEDVEVSAEGEDFELSFKVTVVGEVADSDTVVSNGSSADISTVIHKLSFDEVMLAVGVKYPLPEAIIIGDKTEQLGYTADGVGISVEDGFLVAEEEISGATLTAYAGGIEIIMNISATDYGTLTLDDITMLEFRREKLSPRFSDSVYESDVEYFFSGSDIQIYGGFVTGLTPNTETVVVAKSEFHTATFKVKVLSESVAEFWFTELPETLYTNYPGKPLQPSFRNEAFESELTYKTNDERVKVENGVLFATGRFPTAKEVTVTASSPYFQKSFIVNVSEYNVDNHDTEKKVCYYEENLIKEENFGGTIFIGDSYFDGYPIESKGNKPPFWNDFYEDFAGEKAFLMGISQSQIDELETVSERLVYPMKPKEIVIHIGFNDVHHGPYSVNHLYSRITALIDKFKEGLPDVEIYFMGVEPKKNGYTEGTDFYYSSTVKAKQLTEKMVDFCAVSDRVTYLDTMSIFVNDSGTIKTDAYLSTDFSHPTLASYDKIREAFLAARASKE